MLAFLLFVIFCIIVWALFRNGNQGIALSCSPKMRRGGSRRMPSCRISALPLFATGLGFIGLAGLRAYAFPLSR